MANKDIQGALLSDPVDKLRAENHALRSWLKQMEDERTSLINALDGVDLLVGKAIELIESHNPLDHAIEMYKLEADVLRDRLREIMEMNRQEVSEQREVMDDLRHKLSEQHARIASLEVGIKVADRAAAHSSAREGS